MNQNAAVTRLEFLVALAVSIVLVALLIQTSGPDVKGHFATKDLNNLKNLGQAMVAYLDENHDEMFSPTATAQDVWPQQLRQKYLKDWNAFRSPYDPISSARPKAGAEPVPVSYALNGTLMGTSARKWETPTSSLIAMAPAVDFNIPGKSVVFRKDAVSSNHIVLHPPGPGAKRGTHQNRESINVLFADWHVATTDWEKFADDTSAEGKARWEPMAKP
jgi:prepilin-type processing-associated H-X9-DG protein